MSICTTDHHLWSWGSNGASDGLLIAEQVVHAYWREVGE